MDYPLADPAESAQPLPRDPQRIAPTKIKPHPALSAAAKSWAELHLGKFAHHAFKNKTKAKK
jgi:hypothetical protein